MMFHTGLSSVLTSYVILCSKGDSVLDNGVITRISPMSYLDLPAHVCLLRSVVTQALVGGLATRSYLNGSTRSLRPKKREPILFLHQKLLRLIRKVCSEYLILEFLFVFTVWVGMEVFVFWYDIQKIYMDSVCWTSPIALSGPVT